MRCGAAAAAATGATSLPIRVRPRPRRIARRWGCGTSCVNVVSDRVSDRVSAWSMEQRRWSRRSRLRAAMCDTSRRWTTQKVPLVRRDGACGIAAPNRDEPYEGVVSRPVAKNELVRNVPDAETFATWPQVSPEYS